MDAETIENGAPLRTRLVGRLRSAIGSGQLSAGAKLNERELCEEFGVSRTVVRECLRQLEAEGFITMQPHKGAIVTEISYVRAMHLFELRGALEALACELCALRATPEQKRALAGAVDEIERVMAKGDLDALLVAKNRFYAALLDGAGNPEVSSMLQLLHARINILRRYSLSASGRHAHSLEEIRAMLSAIIAGDGEAARRAGQHHVAQSRAAALPQVFHDQFATE